jgi:L-alanine-DL-glutamate epimerase-like enolase superfamily enzyme
VRLHAEKFTIQLRKPFRIAHGSSTTRESILVHLYDDDESIVGHGEGALPPYYPSTADACLRWLEEIAGREDTWKGACVEEVAPTTAAARVALEIALHDLQAQRTGKPLYRTWGLDAAQIPLCWRTVPIPPNERELREMLDEEISSGSRRIKLKSGSGDRDWDEDCVRVASELPIHLGLDANEGWTPAEAAKLFASLAPLGISFVEQPVSREAIAWKEMRSRVQGIKVPPLVADESLQTEDDLAAFEALADGVNVKLLKAGGFAGARRWISRARELGMTIMVGTMVESGIGRTAAAQLAPLANWLDIDAPESIPAAPMIGFNIEGDRLFLSDRPGLGLRAI